MQSPFNILEIYHTPIEKTKVVRNCMHGLGYCPHKMMQNVKS